MSVFADQVLLRFLDDAFVADLVRNHLGVEKLFAVTYDVEDFEIKEIDLDRIERRRFQVPAFETVRTRGTKERTSPGPERVQVSYEAQRKGRLAWVEVLVELRLASKVLDGRSPIKEITAISLLEKLGPVSSLASLRNKLLALYPVSVVDAVFERLRITNLAEFKREPHLFLELTYEAPLPYDAADPRVVRSYPLNMCVLLQPELKISEAVQTAKLCRSILENERDFAETFDGGAIVAPYAFVVMFPASLAVDNAIPGVTAAELKTQVASVFAAERMLTHFVST